MIGRLTLLCNGVLFINIPEPIDVVSSIIHFKGNGVVEYVVSDIMKIDMSQLEGRLHEEGGYAVDDGSHWWTQIERYSYRSISVIPRTDYVLTVFRTTMCSGHSTVASRNIRIFHLKTPSMSLILFAHTVLISFVNILPTMCSCDPRFHPRCVL